MAAAFWAVDLYSSHTSPAGSPSTAYHALGKTGGMLLLVAVLSIVLTYKFSRWPNVRILDQMAVVYYAPNQMYSQALLLYEYIYAHPENVTPDTPVHYGTILLASGKRDEAQRVLSAAAAEMEAQDPPERKLSEHLRRLVKVHTLLGDTNRADVFLGRAIAFETEKIEATSDPDERAMRLWSVARAWEARGNISKAVNMVEKATEAASSPYLRSKIERWMVLIVKSQMNSFGEDISSEE